MKSETQIQKEIINYLKARNSYLIRVVLAADVGAPDIVVCYRGKFLGIEVKKPGCDLSPAQKLNMILIRSKKGKTLVARSVTDVKNCLDEIDKELKDE